MKTILIALLAIIVVSGLLFAQGLTVPGSNRDPRGGTNRISGGYLGIYEGNTPPPVSLPEAYDLALAHIGPASNSFYCVRASCVDTNGHRGWTFTFANTNGQRGRVIVYFTKGVSPLLPGGGRMFPDK
jgi:hypothetical protein